jgi:hydrogenase expression/formation protein HypD
MKYLDEFRDPRLARALLAEIRRATTRPWTIMEICGGQTHSLLRHGIDQELAGLVELVHGPGCPVCVTPMEAVDLARDYCLRPATLLASFGDMLRVPGSRGSLLQARAEGGHVQAVYSPRGVFRRGV